MKICLILKQIIFFRLDLLQALTDNGRDILHLEDEFSEFLLKWTPKVIGVGKAAEVLSLFLNVIKYNASYIDDNNMADIVEYVFV